VRVTIESSSDPALVGTSWVTTEDGEHIPDVEPTQADLTFRLFQATSRARCNEWHNGFPDNTDWSIADWSNAMEGEAGELMDAVLVLFVASKVVSHTGAIANLVKKMRRIEEGLVGNRGAELGIEWETLVDKVEEEAGDVVAYLDLLMTKLGRELGVATAKKFNKVSDQLGFPYKVPPG
jgi:NTP pyrophosphatase (non-canonical NTP hydrolase)